MESKKVEQTEYTPKWVLRTTEFDVNTLNWHVMGIVLKVLTRLKKKDKKLVISRWNKFFNAILPDALYFSPKYKTYSVVAFGKALKFLVEEGFVAEEELNDKSYKLYSLVDKKKQVIIDNLEENVQDYDDDLMTEINYFIEEFDTPKGKDGKPITNSFKAWTQPKVKQAEKNVADDEDIPF